MNQGRIYYGWIIVAAAIVIGFLTTGLGGYANGILLPHLADELAGGSRGQISVLFSLGTIFVAIISPFIGRYADNNSATRVMLIGAGVLGLSYIVLGAANSLWALFLAKGILYAVALAMVGPLVRNMLIAHWFTRLRGRALGFSVMGASIAGVTLPLILSNMVTSLGWRPTVYVFGAIIGVVLLPLIYFVLRDKPQDLGLNPDGASSEEMAKLASKSVVDDIDETTWTWKQMLQSKALWATGLTFGPMVCVYIVIIVHLFGHAVESGLEDSQAAMILSAFALTSIVGKPMIGVMADAIGSRITLWIALLLQAVALVAFAFAGSLFAFIIAALIHGFGYAALSSMRTFALAQAFGVRSLGSAMGLLSWIELPFAALASPLAGFVFDATGSYDSAFLVFAGFLLIGCIGPFFLDAKNLSKEKTPQAA